MSAIGTFNYTLANFLVPILQPLTGNQYTVYSSLSFVDEITQLTLSHGAVMVSFDIASFFINIPLEEIVNIILDNLFPILKRFELKIASSLNLSLRNCLNLQ